LSDLQACTGSPDTLSDPGDLVGCQNRTPPRDGKLIAAFGNSLRADDGVGGNILDRLEMCGELPENVQLQWNASPASIVDAIISKQYKKVIIVDAVFFNQNPGNWKQFSLNVKTAPKVWQKTHLSIHSMDLIEILELCSALKIDLPEISIYGVQPKEVNFSKKLSVSVQKSIPDVCIAILEDLRE
jgi:hydrogenase maturation protease